ncbi:hypothetical protein ACJX0J_008508, partial [Zea mays]
CLHIAKHAQTIIKIKNIIVPAIKMLLLRKLGFVLHQLFGSEIHFLIHTREKNFVLRKSDVLYINQIQKHQSNISKVVES